MTAGIVGYGVYVPMRRIKVEEIARVWEKDAKRVSEGLGVFEKAVAAMDEDSCTLAVEAARRAVTHAGIDSKKIGAIYVGSESKPYAVKPTATVVGDALGCGPNFMAADLEFACKAGTAGMQMCQGFVLSDMIDYGMSIGTDTAQSRPNDPLEFTAGSGAAAFIIGREKGEMIAEIVDTLSFTTDTPDFWRRQHAEFPKHAGRFTGEPAYFKHVVNAAKGIMEKTKMKATDFDYAVFHQPNGKFPMLAAKMLGIDSAKVKPGLVTPYIGNTYSAASMIGLAAVLDEAKPEKKILCVSYGSGAGSDAFVIKTTKLIEKKKPAEKVFEMIKKKEYVDYAIYAKHRKKIKSI